MIKDYFKAIDINITDKQAEAFAVYYDMLIEWNNKFNLTAITDEESVYIKHFIDSAYVLKYLDLQGKVVDVGTGAGFPGVVLKILQPSIELTLVESNKKKTTFLEALAEKLKLDIKVINARGEELADYKNSFDFALARAVANLAELNEIMIPLLKIGGSFIALKGPNYQEEYTKKSFETFNSKLLDVHTYTLLNSNDKRAILIIKKEGLTNPLYPRPYAQIKKKPIR